MACFEGGCQQGQEGSRACRDRVHDRQKNNRRRERGRNLRA